MNKKEIKKQVKLEFTEDKERKKARKEELSKLSAEEKSQAEASDKRAAKEKKEARKKEIADLTGEDKKIAKKHDKYYRKLKRKPVTNTIWGVVGVCFVIICVKLAPIVSDAKELLSLNVDTSTEEGVAARENGEKLARQITDDGIILLKNTDDLLPLVDKNVNVFGTQAQVMRLAGGGSGGADTSRAIDLFTSLENAGIEYNKDLKETTAEAMALDSNNEVENSNSGAVAVISGILNPISTDELPIDYLTSDVMANAKDFSNNALIVLTSDSVESSDANPEDLKVKGDKLALIEEVAKNFENVIIVVNAGNSLELGFIEEYPSIKAVLSCGVPGATGPTSLAEIIAGNVNPSGRLTDTLVYDNTSAPATENFGDYKYDNVGDEDKRLGTLEYEEGIYVGYRYYETRYKNDEQGYNDTVLYPFGYGLSYTDFDWEVVDQKFDNENITVKVKVTNTGDVAGKEVVQVYYEPPYKKGGIEKSAIALADFEKTKLLQPKESEVLTITYPTRHMASWDMKNGNYVLENGTYNINVSKNVHDTVESKPFKLDKSIAYNESLTGYAYENQFDYANGDLTYLSRNDWETSYPTADDISTHASDELLNNYDEYLNPPKSEEEVPTLGAENNIKLNDLKGLDYDDPKWDAFLDQFTFEELNTYFTHGGWKTLPIERLGVPASVLLDGPAGINFFFKSITTAAYPAELLLASTWDKQLAYAMGESMGTEANAYGVHGIYAPAMNLHRTAYGGRNFEYFSEDPVISGKMGTNVIEGIQSKDVVVTMKHFIMNDQEVNARSGLFVWSNEQAIRELYLKPFEMAQEETKVSGIMSSFIFLGHKWNGANSDLLNDVVRGEMGFDGFVSSDATFWFMDPTLALRNGNDLMLAALPTPLEKKVAKAYEEDPAGIVIGLRDRVHTTLYTLLNRSKFAD